MPTDHRDHEIEEQLACLETERQELNAALASGDLSKAEHTKSVSKNHFLAAQLKEQNQGGAERDKERQTEKQAERQRDIFED